MTARPGKTKIFFDGNCIVCDLEISHYKRIAPETFELVDISDPRFEASRFGWKREDVDRELHVVTPEGEPKIGVDAFVHIWERIPKYRWLARLIRKPVPLLAARAGYRVFIVIRPYLPKKSWRTKRA